MAPSVFNFGHCTMGAPRTPQIHTSPKMWERHRSSRLNAQYRVIYQVDEHTIQVMVMDVTAHDYRRQ